MPPSRLLSARVTRAAPYIYTEEQISSLIGAADRLTPMIRGATFHTMIALMAATGLRTGEALGLDIANLDQQAGTLTGHRRHRPRSRPRSPRRRRRLGHCRRCLPNRTVTIPAPVRAGLVDAADTLVQTANNAMSAAACLDRGG